MPSLSTTQSKELEEISAELEKERTARKSIADEKKALEEELESLSQALFEEVRNSPFWTLPHDADVIYRPTKWSQRSEKCAPRRKRS